MPPWGHASTPCGCPWGIPLLCITRACGGGVPSLRHRDPVAPPPLIVPGSGTCGRGMGHLPPVSPPKGKRETRDTFTGGGGTLPGNYQVSHTGTYTGDPPSGLTTRGAFLCLLYT